MFEISKKITENLHNLARSSIRLWIVLVEY